MKKLLTILLYHGVTQEKPIGISNYSGKHIDFNIFEKQMNYLKNNFSLLSMDEVICIKKNKKEFPSKSVAVTFDDGFKNNYTLAMPLLEKYQIPTTFYVCAGMINTKSMF